MADRRYPAFVFVRHGESEWNAREANGGDDGRKGEKQELLIDPRLTAKGREEARRAGALLAARGYRVSPSLLDGGDDDETRESTLNEELEFEAIVSSPFVRAQETLGIILGELSASAETPVELRDELRELSYGEWEERGLSLSDPEVIELRKRWTEGLVHEAAPGGDSPFEICERARKVVFELRERPLRTDRPPGSVLIVCHGRTLKALLASLLPEYGLESMDRLPQSNGCLNFLRFDLHAQATADELNVVG
jgi:broad specificity phosphatase PhoE